LQVVVQLIEAAARYDARRGELRHTMKKLGPMKGLLAILLPVPGAGCEPSPLRRPLRTVLLGHGDRTFTARPLPESVDGGTLHLVDLDGDGRRDLAVAGTTGVRVHQGAGDGAFRLAWTEEAFYDEPEIRAAQLDGDALADLVVFSYKKGTAAKILLNTSH
jgi:hypothetical protein